eukprot:266761-Amphidinium_carterae.1
MRWHLTAGLWGTYVPAVEKGTLLNSSPFVELWFSSEIMRACRFSSRYLDPSVPERPWCYRSNSSFAIVTKFNLDHTQDDLLRC